MEKHPNTNFLSGCVKTYKGRESSNPDIKSSASLSSRDLRGDASFNVEGLVSLDSAAVTYAPPDFAGLQFTQIRGER
ncbi:hypothetical protein ACTXT7_016426 [Hymenolepis weldensis]